MDELKQVKQIKLVSWPSPQDYNEAVQNPAFSFADGSLAASHAEADSFGLPRPNTGMFASVYRMHCKDCDWALRCFLHFIPDQVERYAAIGEALSLTKLSSTLHFEMQERGVRVRGQWFPILKMQWCDGETLDRFIASRLHDRRALERFLSEFKRVLAEFDQAGIAHGDLQHGNILISNEQVKFVDYDGMYVPGLHGKISNELGHRDYQHPGRLQEHFGPELDHFSSWVIYLSALIISLDPSVWTRLNGGDDCLIFRRRDFEDPRHSPAFHLLENHPNADIRQAARLLRSMLLLDPEAVPSLSSTPLVPGDLPDLLEPRSAAQERGSPSSSENRISDNAHEDDDTAFGSAPVYYGKKRQRSRLKGGSRIYRPTCTPAAGAQPQNLNPKTVSPLAQLVRRLNAENASGVVSPSRALSGAPVSITPTTSGSFTTVSGLQTPISSSAWPTPFWKVFLLITSTTGFCLFFVLALLVERGGEKSLSPLLAKGDSYFRQEKFEEAAAEYQRVADYYHKSAEAKGLNLAANETRLLEASAVERLGNAHFREHDYMRALDDYTNAVRIYQACGGHASIGYARAVGRQGKAYEALGRIYDAYQAYADALSMYRRLGIHPDLNTDMDELISAQSRISLASGH